MTRNRIAWHHFKIELFGKPNYGFKSERDPIGSLASETTTDHKKIYSAPFGNKSVFESYLLPVRRNVPTLQVWTADVAHRA